MRSCAAVDHQTLLGTSRAKTISCKLTSKPNHIMIRSSSSIQNYSQDDQPDDRRDFDQRKPKLCFSIIFDTEEIDDSDEDKHDCDPDSGVEIGPVRDWKVKRMGRGVDGERERNREM